MSETDSQVEIRPGTLADVSAIATFQLAMAEETEGKTLDMEVVVPAVEAVFHDPSKGHYFVAELEREVIGGLLVTFEWSDWRNFNIWYIQSVYVSADHRGKGVFKQLYHAVMESAEAEGVGMVRLYVEHENHVAQATYEKLGMSRLPYHMYQVKLGD